MPTEDCRVWIARKPKTKLENGYVRLRASGSLQLVWSHGDQFYTGIIERKLARLMAKRINEALDAR